MSPEKFDEFIERTGLKKTMVANILSVPVWVLSEWKSGKTKLSPRQQTKLDEFCKEFYENNRYVQFS